MAAEHQRHDAISKEVTSASIQVWRESAGLSQAKVAATLQISERAFRNYELGIKHLPPSVRLTFISEYQLDPIPTDLLCKRLGLPEPKPVSAPHSTCANDQDFWQKLRVECRSFRQDNFSKPAQAMLALRDHLYAAATFYFGLKHLSLVTGIPYGLTINGTDWMFFSSFALILLLFPAIISEIPLLKIARHLLKR